MTRRKRTPSPSPSPSPSASSKRVAFEIPASLRHFSSISRSLATNTSPPSGSTTTPPQIQIQTQTQHRPTSQSSNKSFPPFTTSHPPRQIPANNVSTQRPSTSAPNAQTWAPPPQKGVQVTSIAKPKPSSPALPRPRSAKPPNVSPVHIHTRTASNPTPSARTPPEPTLRPGETPVLKTHPNLIASLIAKKRAANEAAGHRARWQKQQAEYQAGKSPGSQLMTELKVEASRASPIQSQPRSVSNPLPARPIPPSVTNSQSLPLTVETPTPAAETVTTPATEHSTHETGTPNDAEQDQTESVYGSPFSSPIADFLEQATDDAGLRKDVTGPSLQSDHPPKSFKEATPSSTTHGQGSVIWALQSGNIGPPTQVGIPPLFSENPQSHQQKQSPLVRTPFLQNPSTSSQQQASPYQSPHFSTGQLHPGHSISNSAVIAQQQYHYLNSQYPDGQQNFYKMNFPPQYSTANSPGGTPMTMPVAMSQQNFAQQNLSNAPGFNPLVPYPTQPLNGMGHLNIPVIYPPSGPVATYGTSIPKLGSDSEPSLMTAADMVAGAHSMFRIATQADFSVPKRY